MTRTTERALRVIALLIVVAAIVDPMFTTERAVPPVVSVLSADTIRYAGPLAQTERALARTATVVRGPAPNAQAVVVVGSTWPAMPTRVSTPHFAIPSATTNGLHVEAVDAPTVWTRDARMSVRVRLVRDSGMAETPATLSLRDEGQLQSQQDVALAGQQRQVATLSYTPVSTGTRALEIFVADGADTLRFSFPVQVSSTPWRVLVYDARPSWLSTFVRRALERDSRFAVSSRIVTSKDVTLATPQSARTIEALLTQATQDSSSLPHVVVIGAPERLTARDVAALRTLMEEWGRAVVVLPDHLPTAASIGALNSLLGVSTWRELPAAPTSAPRSILREHGHTGDSLRLAASVAAAPSPLPADATVLAVSGDTPVVWTRPVGRGLVLTSSGFDTWRFRDPAQSTFDKTWRELVATAAQDVNPALSFARRGSATVRPQALIEALIVAARPASLLAAPSVSVRRHAGAGDTEIDTTARLPVAVYSTASEGTWLAQVRAPSVGAWRLEAVAAGDTATLPLLVVEHAPSNPDTPIEQLAAWTNITGGRLVPQPSIDSLPAIIEARLGSPRQTAPWRPMRSPWWILPLTLALGGDWWLRRRRGAR